MRPLSVWLVLALCSSPLASVTSWAAGADSSFDSDSAPDLTPVRAKIQAKDYKGALADLREMKATADVYNLMGYSLRKAGDPKQAFGYYEHALALDPAHKETLEYLGELYVETGQMDQAREKAARLRALCPSGCEALSELEDAIETATPEKH